MTHIESSTNGSTNTNQLNVPRLESSVSSILLGAIVERRRVEVFSKYRTSPSFLFARELVVSGRVRRRRRVDDTSHFWIKTLPIWDFLCVVVSSTELPTLLQRVDLRSSEKKATTKSISYNTSSKSVIPLTNLAMIL